MKKHQRSIFLIWWSLYLRYLIPLLKITFPLFSMFSAFCCVECMKMGYYGIHLNGWWAGIFALRPHQLIHFSTKKFLSAHPSWLLATQFSPTDQVSSTIWHFLASQWNNLGKWIMNHLDFVQWPNIFVQRAFSCCNVK